MACIDETTNRNDSVPHGCDTGNTSSLRNSTIITLTKLSNSIAGISDGIELLSKKAEKIKPFR